MLALTRRLALAALFLVPLAPVASAAETVTIFAAASLKDAVDEAAAAFKAKTGTEIKASYAASSALAKQIEQGAPADIFASADLKWMDYVDKAGLVQSATRVNLLGNELVVVVPKDAKVDAVELTPEGFDKAVGSGRWATGAVDSVPVGIYAKQALTKLGIWTAAEPKIAQAENVRAALQFVARGEVNLGIVYKTDANADQAVKVAATFPEGSHDAIVYPFAVTKAAKGEAAAQFLAFLTGEEARPIFEKQGFVVLKK